MRFCPNREVTRGGISALKENRLFVEKANAPPGRHRLKISITDRNGNTTAATLQLTVK